MKRVLICGLGSIGQRHARNLRQLFGPALHIGAFRERGLSGTIREDLQGFEAEPVEKRYGIEVFTDLCRALESSWDAVFVTNPIHRHLPVAIQAALAGFPLFIEKPLGDNLDQAKTLSKICQEKKLIVMVAFQLRFQPLLIQLKHRLESGEFGRVLRGSFHFGEYMPGMHPYEDYRDSHMASRNQGGGVINCLSHELDLALWLVGFPGKLSAHGGKLTDTEHDVEDFVDLIGTVYGSSKNAPQALIQIHLNFWQRPLERHFSIITEKATIHFDYFKATTIIQHRELPEENIALASFARNEMFLAEVRHFVECVETHSTPSPNLHDGLQVLQMADAAHISLKEHREVHVL